VVLGARRQPQLGEDAVDVLLDGALGDHQPLGDRLVGAALGHQREHLTLVLAQVLDRVVALPGPPHQLGDDYRVEHRTAAGDAAHGVGQGGKVGDPVLEQVPDRSALSPAGSLAATGAWRRSRTPGCG
jgi:hypothetical protein